MILPDGALPQVGIVASAEEIATSGQCGDNVYWELVDDHKLIISGTGDIYNYEAKTEWLTTTIYTSTPWYLYKNQITSIIIEEGVTRLGDNCFRSMENIEYVEMPDSVTSMGEAIFRECTKLKDIKLSKNVTYIPNSAFERTALTEFVVPDKVTSIGTFAFYGCSNLIKITIPKTVTSINSNWTGAFGGRNSNLTFYGYSGSYAETWAKDNNIPFIALDDYNSDYTTNEDGSMSYNGHRYKVFDNVADTWEEARAYCESLGGHLAVINDEEENSVIYSYMKKIGLENAYFGFSDYEKEGVWKWYGDESQYTNWHQNEPNNDNNEDYAMFYYKYQDGSWNDGDFGKNTFNGDTNFICEWESDSENATDTTNDSRYENLVLDFAPANLTFEYSEENGEITPASSDCSAGLAYGKIAIDKELFLEVNKVTIKAPKGFGFNESRSQESLTQTCVTPESIYTIGDENPSFDFTLYAPTKEFLDGNVVDKTYYPNLTITVYGDNGFVKTFEESITVKYKPLNSEPKDDIPENAIIISKDVIEDKDIVVNEGDYVVICNANGENYKVDVNCNNLYVNGGTCVISDTATLNVKNNVEVKGGYTNWSNPISFDKEGGVLKVNGQLNVGNNMLVSAPCGILQMTNSKSIVDVKGNFTITTNSTKYTCSLSNGILKIGGDFESSGKYPGNFQATGSHLTLFYGSDFDITIDKSKSYFNNLSFTENALNSVTYNDKLKFFKLYSSNVKGKFYLYGKNTDLSYLFEDHEEVVSTIVGAYNDYLSDSQFKKSMSGLRKYLNDDYYDKIVADVMMFCELENLAIATDNSEYGINLIGPWKNYLDSSDNLTGATANFANGKTLLSFSMDNNLDVYICLSWLGSSLGSSNSGASSASCFFVRWIVDDNGTYCANKNIISLSYTDLNNLTNQLVQVYKDSTKTNGTVGDFISWFQNYILGTYKDLNMVYNGLTFQKGELDLSKAQNISTWCNKVYKAITNKSLKGFFFQIQSPLDALKVPDKITQFVKSDMTAKDFETLITCPVNVEVKNSSGEIVASVIDNKVIVSSDEVTINVINGDQKQCVFHSLDDFSITLTATDDGTMNYYIYESENSNATRTITFKNLSLNKGIVYTGQINDYTKKDTSYFKLTDSNGKTYNADSDIDIDNHTHSYRSEWKYNSSSHWHECSCGEKSNIADHISDNGKITVKPTATSTGVKAYSCTVCEYVIKTETIPATGNTGNSGNNGGNGNSNGYNPTTSTPSYTSTTSTTSVTQPKLTLKAITNKNKVTLKWNKIANAKNYTVYRLINGKYVKLKDTDKTSITYKNLKNGKTYNFLVKYTVNGRESSNSNSGKASVTVKYKPIVKVSASQNSVKLTWGNVTGAEKYAVYKYINGKAVKLIETTKRTVKINKLSPDTKYQYIVRAYVDGKWTTMKKSDVVTAKTLSK